MIGRIGSRHTPLAAWRIYRRAHRFARLREDQAIDNFLNAIRRERLTAAEELIEVWEPAP